MYSLIISAVFIPFLWGDSNVSTQEIKGFTSLDECYGAAIEVGKTKKGTRDGYLQFTTQCIKVK